MRRLSSALAAAAVGTAVLAVGVPGASAATKISGEIRFLSNDIYVVPDKAAIARFEKKYPGVKVNLQSVAGGAAGINLVLQPQLQANGGPDVTLVFAGRGINPSGPKLY
jgi:ABC-type glycerol-3-phosphate transport system substrate-binding protein